MNPQRWERDAMLAARGQPVDEPPAEHDEEAVNMRRFVVHDERSRRKALVYVAAIPVEVGARYYVEIGEHDEGRPAQIRKVFKRCREVAAQLPFPGTDDWAGEEDWYRLLIGLMRGERFAKVGRIVVMLGGGLSKATRTEREDLIRFIEAWGTERGVRFSED